VAALTAPTRPFSQLLSSFPFPISSPCLPRSHRSDVRWREKVNGDVVVLICSKTPGWGTATVRVDVGTHVCVCSAVNV
jgi:hypothetical protein